MRSETIVEKKYWDDKGNELKVGDMVTFFFGGRQLVGKFLGSDKNSFIKIESKLGDMEVTFHATVNKIDELHKCQLILGGDSIG